MSRHVAAADHADVLTLARAEDKLVQTGALFAQQRERHLLAAPLHSAAADRAEETALPADEHQRALAARRAAGGRDE